MSLSDYSSDEGWEDEEAIVPEAIAKVEAKMKDTFSTRKLSSSSLVVAASLALGAAAVGAGVWLYRRYWIEGGDAEKERSQEEGDKEHNQHRKDLRRKRTDVLGSEAKESPKPVPFMLRTESASSVGPLRKQPRRDTSEDSEGATGASPSEASHSQRRALRKTASAASRHRRPPRRPPVPGQAPAGYSTQGTESESDTGKPRQKGGFEREASASFAPAAEAGSQEPRREGKETQALLAEDSGGPTASQDAAQPSNTQQPAQARAADALKQDSGLSTPDVSPPKEPPLIHRVHTASEALKPSAPVSDKRSEDGSSAKQASPSESHIEDAAETPIHDVKEPASRGASTEAPENTSGSGEQSEHVISNGQAGLQEIAAPSDKAASPEQQPRLPDLLPQPLDANSQSSISTFTAEVDVLEAAVQAAADSSADPEPAPGNSSVQDNKQEAKKDSPPAAEGKSERAEKSDEPEQPAQVHESKTADATGKGQATGSEHDDVNAIAKLQAELDKQNNLPDAAKLHARALPEKDEASQVDESQSAESAGNKQLEGGVSENAGKQEENTAREQQDKGRKPRKDGGVNDAAEEEAAAAGVKGAPTVAQGSQHMPAPGHEQDRMGSRALTAEPSLVLRAVSGASDQKELDLSAVEGDAVGQAVDAEEAEPSESDAAEGDITKKATMEETSIPDQGNKHEEAASSKNAVSGGNKAAADDGQDGEQDAPSLGAAEDETSRMPVSPVDEEREASAQGASADETGLRCPGQDVPSSADAAKQGAVYDPLELEAEHGIDSAEGKLQEQSQEVIAEETESVEPQNQAERNVDLNLSVALRLVSEKRNLAAAEKTLRKALEAVKEGSAEVRPHFRCRLAGTLADIIARAEQEKPASRSKEDRRGEIVELQQFAFEAAKETGDGDLRAKQSWRVGAALAEMEAYEEALPFFQDELAYRLKHNGIADPSTQMCRTWTADMLNKMHRKEDACKLLKDAAESLEQEAERISMSKEHSSSPTGQDGNELSASASASLAAAKCYVHLATIHDEDGDFKAAEGPARKAMAVMDAAFGRGNPRCSTTYGTLASILKHKGTEEALSEAIDLYSILKSISDEQHGVRNNQAAMALRSIADIYLLLKEYGEAVSYNEKAEQVASGRYGRDHPVMESFWRAVAESRQLAGDKEGAKEANRQALRVRSHAQRPGNASRSMHGGPSSRRGRGRSRR